MTKHNRLTVLLVILLFGNQSAFGGWQFTGRAAFSSQTAFAEPGDLGYVSSDEKLTYSDIQSLRFMQDAHFGIHELSAHYRVTRTHTNSLYLPDNLFRYTPLDHHFASQSGTLDWRQEIDYLNWKLSLGKVRLIAGRQAISLSNGRFWQPLDIFGSFAPTELDREYKVGIDAFTTSWYPGDFSDISLYLVSGQRDSEDKLNYALRAQHQFNQSTVAILQYGRSLGYETAGLSVETILLDQAVRFETLFSKIGDELANFSTLGTERQLEDNTVVSLELYANSLGSWETNGYYQESRLARQAAGLQNHLGKYLLAMSLGDQITPLMSGSYLLLLNPAREANTIRYSWMHQLAINYSLGNETEGQFAVMTGYGKALENDKPASEFGHIPLTVSLRIHSYF